MRNMVAFSASLMFLFNPLAQGATLLSNVSNARDGAYVGNPDSADHFMTGSEALMVTGVNVVWEAPSDVPGVNRVFIYTDAGGFPSSTIVGTSFNNAAATSAGLMQYTGSAQLAPETVYWVVVDIYDGSRIAWTGDDSFDADPKTGGAQILPRSANGDSELVSWRDDEANLQYEIVGVSTEYQYQIGPEMTASFYDPDFEGSGINTEILTLPAAAKDGEKGGAGTVVVYLYSFDIFGAPIFAFGVGSFEQDTMTVEMLIDYDGTGPFWGPAWDPSDFAGAPFADLEIVWSDCANGVANLTMDLVFLLTNPGWANYGMNLTRITNAAGLPGCP